MILPAGQIVDQSFSIPDPDDALKTAYLNPVVGITNYEYEEKIEENKRNIFLLKPKYLNIIIDDMDDIMKYEKGSGQFKTETLKTADNIKIYL